MTARDDDRFLSTWLHDVAPGREPEHLLGEVLARTARTRRRSAWRIPERWNPMSAITSRFTPASPASWRLLAVGVALLLALAVALMLLGTGHQNRIAPPYGLAANGPLYYSQGGDLFARVTSAAARPILAGSENDSDPVLSPDGTKLSFLRHIDADTAELWVVNADGSQPHRLDIPSAQLSWFEWAPQGDAAVVLSDADPRAMTIVPADGSPSTRRDLGIKIEDPTFLAPNGSKLGFMGTDAGGNRGIYQVNRDGTGLSRLALDAGYVDDPTYEQDRDYYFWTASWSSTGNRLLYTQLEPAPGSPAGPGFRNRLAVIDSAGRVISDEILQFTRTADDEFAAVWLPGSDGFVFQSDEGPRHWLSTAALGPGGAGPATNLGVAADDWIASQISPDGRQLIVVLPAAAGAPNVVEQVDLSTLAVTPLDVGADATWQRLPSAP